MRCALLVAVAFVSVSCGSSRQPPIVTPPGVPVRSATIRSPGELVAAMHERYAGQWYRNITFIQTSSYFRADGTPSRVETWYEALALPGRLRIDLGDLSKGNGVVYRSDSVYQIQNGRITDARPGRNPLMILGFDVYGQPPARTLAQLQAERVDVTVLRMDTLYGRRMYVVGAGPADATTNQFWVEADRLLFVRLIQTDARGRTQDIRFERYVKHGGGWVAEEVRVLAAGRMVFHEEYQNVRVNVTLDDNLFIPEKWSAAKHWHKP